MTAIIMVCITETDLLLCGWGGAFWGGGVEAGVYENIAVTTEWCAFVSFKSLP